MIEELIKQFEDCLEGLQALDVFLEEWKSAQNEEEEESSVPSKTGKSLKDIIIDKMGE